MSLPADAEMGAFQQPSDVVTWASLRMIAAGLNAAMQQVRAAVTGHPARERNLAESMQFGLIWRAARKCCGIADMDPLAPPDQHHLVHPPPHRQLPWTKHKGSEGEFSAGLVTVTGRSRQVLCKPPCNYWSGPEPRSRANTGADVARPCALTAAF